MFSSPTTTCKCRTNPLIWTPQDIDPRLPSDHWTTEPAEPTHDHATKRLVVVRIVPGANHLRPRPVRGAWCVRLDRPGGLTLFPDE